MVIHLDMMINNNKINKELEMKSLLNEISKDIDLKDNEQKLNVIMLGIKEVVNDLENLVINNMHNDEIGDLFIKAARIQTESVLIRNYK